MNRMVELTKLFENFDEDKKTLIYPLLEDIVFLEKQLSDLKKLPFISVNPANNFQQKSTPAAKLYKELLQQLVNVVKALLIASKTTEEEEDSPLRQYLKGLQNAKSD